MYLSYSGFEKYQECPKAYWHSYIASTPLPKPENRINMLYGSIVGLLFEQFYNEQLWRKPGMPAEMAGRIPGAFKKVMEAEKEKGGVFDWTDKKAKYKNEKTLLSDVRDTIPRGLAAIKLHRMIGVKAEAEVKLDVDFDIPGGGRYRVGGRADFVIHRIAPHNDFVILDGKGSAWRDSYAKPRQLRWYAVQHKRKYGTIPDKVGFLFWRSEPENSVDWHSVTEKDVTDLQEVIQEVVISIEESRRKLPVVGQPSKELLHDAFPARASKQACSLCNYKTICPEGTLVTTGNFRVPVSDEAGVEDVGL